MADTKDLKSFGATPREGSTPSPGTTLAADGVFGGTGAYDNPESGDLCPKLPDLFK
jgi:hypothetical protein